MSTHPADAERFSSTSTLTDRLNKGRLEVPTAKYANSIGREITVIGVKHYATSQFWADLSVQLDALDGETTVHFEKPIRDRVPLPWHLRLTSQIGNSIDRSQHRIWNAAGYEFQFDGLPIGPNWENHDLPISRTLSAFRVGPLVLAAALSLLLSLNLRIAATYARSQVIHLHADAGKTHPTWMMMKTSVILHERNAVAARAALAADNDVVMVWGHAHVAGIGKILEEGGFELKGVTWNLLFAS